MSEPKRILRLSQFSPLRGGPGHALLDRVQDQLVAFLNPLAREVERLANAASTGAATELSNAPPSPLGAATPGTSGKASRGDHAHSVPSPSDIPGFDAAASAAAPVQSVNGKTGAVAVSEVPPVGSNANVLTVVGGVAAWAAPTTGGLAFFDESQSTTAPNATVPVSRFTPKTAATNADIALSPKGTGAIVAHVPNNAPSGGNKRGTFAVDLQASRSNAPEVASGSASAIGGGSGNKATGDYAIVPGGLNNTAQGRAAFATGQNNTASGDQSTSFGGSSTAGAGNTASGTASATLGGDRGIASGPGAVTLGGTKNRGSGGNSVAAGAGGDTRNVACKEALGAATADTGWPSSAGQAQVSKHPTHATTTDATPKTLAATAAIAASTVNTLPNSSVYAIRVQVTARETSTGDVAGWEVTGLVKRGASAAATAVVGVPTVTLLGADAGAAAWAVALAADTTVGAAVVQATGEAGKTIQWVATMHTTELA